VPNYAWLHPWYGICHKETRLTSPESPSTDNSQNDPNPIHHKDLSVVRLGLGGALMGLANLVPGISGGTMLVAVGVYREVIDAIAAASRLGFTRRVLVTLAILIVSAGVAIGGLAWAISWGLAEARWAMYAVFIGLTWGGAPMLFRMTRPFGVGPIVGLVVGILGMLALVWVQSKNGAAGPSGGGPVGLVVGGAAGASAMILPGVSGAYLLLMLGQYEPIISAIKDAVHAATSGDVSGVIDQMGVLVPVGVGVVLGIVVVSNVLKVLIHRFEKPTFGVLLGLLLAAPAGLYPFVEGVPPAIGETIDGVLVTDENVAELAAPENAKDWAQQRFTPGAGHLVGVVLLIGAGFGATLLLSRLSGDEDEGDEDEGTQASDEPATVG
jgi:putative membrane protein